MEQNTREKTLKEFSRLLDIMNDLREKCPWDKVQTKESLRTLTIEETYELSDAILENDFQEMKKELGDILLHIVFYSKIAEEDNQFAVYDVLHSICEKLIVRHPHIYSDTKVESVDDVKKNWENIKLKTGNKSVLSGVPKHLPALVKAQRIKEKVSSVGFDFKNKDDAFDKILEELNELKAEVDKKDKENQEKEFGDLLFSLTNYASFLDINPETALEKTNKKFMKRFSYIEEKIAGLQKQFKDFSLEELEEFYQEAKKQE